MIKVSVMYPNQPGSKFDYDYYCKNHMPMVKEKTGALRFDVDKGLAGGAPGAPATYLAVGNLFYNSVEDFQRGFGPHGKAIMADIPNYTDLAPIVQVSDVLVG